MFRRKTTGNPKGPVVYSTPSYEVTVDTFTGQEILPWRETNFVVRHRLYNVVAGMFQTVHEAIIAAKMLEELTAKILSNLDKPVSEIMADEHRQPTAVPKLH